MGSDLTLQAVDGAHAEANLPGDLANAAPLGQLQAGALDLVGFGTWPVQLCAHDAPLALELAVAGELVLDDVQPSLDALADHVAVGFMVGYGLIAYNIPAVRFRLDRLGDNFYYLGFIYTLASMAAALIQLRESIQIEPILGGFGIALITTIVGVAGRVMLVQMRSEIDDVEEQIRRDLLNASKDLRAQLALALREFETFATAMRQTAEESTKQSAAAARQQIELIASVAQCASGEIKAAFEAHRPSSQELHTLLEKLTSVLESTGMVRRRRWYWPFKLRERIAPRWPRRPWYWPFQR